MCACMSWCAKWLMRSESIEAVIKMKVIPLKKTSFSALLSVVLTLSILAGGGYFLITQMVVKKIICVVKRQDNTTCPDFVQAELEKQLGSSLFFTRFDLVADRVAVHQIGWEPAGVKKDLNGIVTFTFAQPSAIYALKDSFSSTFLVSAEGLVADEASASALPQLQLQDSNTLHLALGSKLSAEMHQEFSSLFASLTNLNIPYRSIVLDNDQNLHLQLNDGKQILLSLEKAPEELAKLKYLLAHQEQLKPKVDFGQVDLRFKYPVLK